MQAFVWRTQLPLRHVHTVMGGDAERPRHCYQELVAGLVCMTAAGDAGLKVVEMKFPVDLERYLLASLRKRKHTPLVTTGREKMQGARDSHREPATRALRYSP